MSALQLGDFCSFVMVNLDRQSVVKIIRQIRKFNKAVVILAQPAIALTGGDSEIFVVNQIRQHIK